MKLIKEFLALNEKSEVGTTRHLAGLVRKYNDSSSKEHSAHMRGDEKKRKHHESNMINSEKEIKKHYGNLKDDQGHKMNKTELSAYDTNDPHSFAKEWLKDGAIGTTRHLAGLVRKYNDSSSKEHSAHMRGDEKRRQYHENNMRNFEKEIKKHYGHLKDDQGHKMSKTELSAYDTDDASSFAKAWLKEDDATAVTAAAANAAAVTPADPAVKPVVPAPEASREIAKGGEYKVMLGQNEQISLIDGKGAIRVSMPLVVWKEICRSNG